MSINALDVIELLPYELQARLEADDYFADIPIIVADKGNVSAELKRKQAVLTEQKGRRGVAVIVLQLVGEDEYPEIMFGPLTLKPAFQVIEHVELNNDERGTKKSARRVARRIHQVMKPLALHGIVTQFKADVPAIEPLNLTAELGEQVVGMQVNFITYEFDVEQLSQVAKPNVAVVATNVELSCATDAASIWYSLDDSFPAPNRPGSTLYSAPLAIPADGLTVRAAAYKAGMIASEVERASVEIE